MKTISSETFSIDLPLVSLKKFLEYVPHTEMDGDQIEYNTESSRIDDSLPTSVDEGGTGPEVTSFYERRIVRLVGGDPTEAALVTLLPQVHPRTFYKGKLSDAVETAVVNSMERFGAPKFLVRLTPRLWLVADPEDFRLVRKGGKSALICYYDLRNIAYSMSRITEEQVIEVISKTSTLAREEIEKLVRKYV